MANGARSAHALLWGVSTVAFFLYGISESAAQAQQSNPAQAIGSAGQDARQKSAKRSKKRQPAVGQAQAPDVLNANANPARMIATAR